MIILRKQILIRKDMARYEKTQHDETTFKHKQQLGMKRKLARNK